MDGKAFEEEMAVRRKEFYALGLPAIDAYWCVHGDAYWGAKLSIADAEAGWKDEAAALLRDIIGPLPFRSVTIAPAL